MNTDGGRHGTTVGAPADGSVFMGSGFDPSGRPGMTGV